MSMQQQREINELRAELQALKERVAELETKNEPQLGLISPTQPVLSLKKRA